MTETKPSRRAIKKGLQMLMDARVDQGGGITDVYPYGPFKDIFEDRDPEDDRKDAILGSKPNQPLENRCAD